LPENVSRCAEKIEVAAMSESIIDVSRDFFDEVVKPILEREFPAETAQTAFGVFGYGSEVLRMDDDYSTDHHWGIRINALMPEATFKARSEAIQQTVSARLPVTWRGHSLREGLSGGRGLSLTSLEAYLMRTIGIDHPPRTYAEWLSIPEEDIIHVVEGEVWHDPSERFTAVRRTLKNYYPEPVRLRRIAHWCRYFSGMGTYALKRALLRNNEYYANVTFTRAIRLGVQLAFLLDRRYFPYDKWTLAFFRQLPRVAARLGPLVEAAVRLSTPWERKLELLDQMSDVLDATLVEDGIIKPHPKFKGSPTSGYRLMEHAYAEIIKGLPDEIKMVVPVWDQIYFEQFHSGYVNSLDMDTWDGLLNLTPVSETTR
jgi:hypothetical protein